MNLQKRSCFILGGGDFVFPDRFVKHLLGLVRVLGIENLADIFGNIFTHAHFGDIDHRVLLKVKMAPIPTHACKNGLHRFFETLMVVTGHHLDTISPLWQRLLKKVLQ